MKILVINGPNLNLLGIREPEIYGIETLEDIRNWMDIQPDASGHEITWFQSFNDRLVILPTHCRLGLQ